MGCPSRRAKQKNATAVVESRITEVADVAKSAFREVLKTMCDYSLMAVPNRLAQEGDELVVHRFHTGSIGLASREDLDLVTAAKAVPRGFWAHVKDFLLLPVREPVCAVCIPPGARLELHGLGPVEQVTFTQTSTSVNSYRDAVRFANDRVLHLQGLPEGLRSKSSTCLVPATSTSKRFDRMRN